MFGVIIFTHLLQIVRFKNVELLVPVYILTQIKSTIIIIQKSTTIQD